MKSYRTLANIFIAALIVSACSSPVNQSTETHVKDMVQSDVFGVLPQSDSEIQIYTQTSEIEGEYLELATVSIQEVGAKISDDEIATRLKEEAKELGGNGVVMVSDKVKEDGKIVTREVKAIAIYALDLMPPVVSTVASLH